MKPPDLEELIQEHERVCYGNSGLHRALTLIDQTISEPVKQDMFIFPGELEMICRTQKVKTGIDPLPGLKAIFAAYAAHYLHTDHDRHDAMKVACIRELILRLQDGTI